MMRQKTVLLTGGTRGIGRQTAIELVKAKYNLVFTARRKEDGEAVTKELEHLSQGSEIDYLLLDLAEIDSINQAVVQFRSLNWPLNVLINNAGYFGSDGKAAFNKEGFELIFAINHLGHFYLTYLLMPDLLASAPSRVLVVSSQTHIPGYGGGPPPDFDFENLKAEKYYQSQVFYKNSKLANMWFTYELARRLDGSGVTVNAVCPGWVPTTIGDRQTSPFRKFLFKQIFSRLKVSRTPEQAARNFLFAADDHSLAQVSGKFIVDQLEITSSEESYDREKALKLWNMSCKWLGIPEDWNLPTVNT